MNKCIEGKKPCLFIFDNLDELDQEYLIETLNLDLLSAFSKAQDFFEKIVLDSTYPFLSKCTIVESIRRNFVATVNSSQFKERVERSSETIKFDSGYEQNARDIVDKRAQLHLSTNKEKLLNNNIEFAKQFNISLIEKEENYIKRLCRFFNLDYRTTLSSLYYALDMDILSWGKNAEKDNDCRPGIRGFLLYNILKYRLKQPNTRFETYVKEDLSSIKSCNRYRMFFSILAKLYNDINVKESDKKKNKSDVFHVSLLEFTDRIKDWYNSVTVQSIYNALFVSGYHNYSLPANLEGETINNYIREKKYNVTLQSLCDHLAELYKKDKDSLSNVDIVVNPLCIEYARHVFIHYEYFNILSVYKDNEGIPINSKSLFQNETMDEIKYCTKRIFEMTKTIINKADNHLCTICGKKCEEKSIDCSTAIKKIQDHGFLIQDNMLYTTRVITSHINYLDSFRKLLWNNYHEKNRNLNNDMQNYLIIVIKDYIDLFRTKRVNNASAHVVFKSIEENLLRAQNSGYDNWEPILIGKSFSLDDN